MSTSTGPANAAPLGPFPDRAGLPWRARALGAALDVAAPVAAALSPLALVVAGNEATHVFPWEWVARPAVVAITVSAVLLVFARVFSKSWTSSSFATTLFLLACPAY